MTVRRAFSVPWPWAGNGYSVGIEKEDMLREAASGSFAI